MSKFLTELDFHLKDDRDDIFILDRPLVYQSTLLNEIIRVPKGFETDLASVPRVPIIFSLWGDRAHREAICHDYAYRIDSEPFFSFDMANQLFLEAMKCRGKSPFIRYPMYWGVCLGGRSSYHQKYVNARL